MVGDSISRAPRKRRGALRSGKPKPEPAVSGPGPNRCQPAPTQRAVAMSQQSTHLHATDPRKGDEQAEFAHENTPARPKTHAAWSLDDCFWKKVTPTTRGYCQRKRGNPGTPHPGSRIPTLELAFCPSSDIIPEIQNTCPCGPRPDILGPPRSQPIDGIQSPEALSPLWDARRAEGRELPDVRGHSEGTEDAQAAPASV